MHYDLLVYYISLFLYNSEESQVFFTSQSILLLDEDFIRRDVVYLSEKDPDTANTSYIRVSDLGLHKNISLYNAYRIGKLGSKPELGSPYLNLTKWATMPKSKTSVAIIGEGITEKYFILSLRDILRIKPIPIKPKNSSLKEL